jgi:hypothetical protein
MPYFGDQEARSIIRDTYSGVRSVQAGRPATSD